MGRFEKGLSHIAVALEFAEPAKGPARGQLDYAEFIESVHPEG